VQELEAVTVMGQRVVLVSEQFESKYRTLCCRPCILVCCMLLGVFCVGCGRGKEARPAAAHDVHRHGGHHPGGGVEETFTLDRTGLPEECLAMPDSHHKTMCLQPFFKAFSAERFAKAAIGFAKQMKEDGLIDDCHHIAHAIGWLQLRRNQEDLISAFRSCSAQCVQGCLHGVMQSYIPSTELTADSIVKTLPALCRTVAAATEQDLGIPAALIWQQCVHGLGHGMISEDFLPLAVAIRVCRQLPSLEEAEWCLGGIFMETTHPLLMMEEDAFLRALPEACGAVKALDDTDLVWRCANGIGEAIMFYTGHDLNTSLDWCGRLPAAQQQECRAAAEEELWTVQHLQ